MAKPDWGELQRRFLSDHAATGVSPKDWCEAQGLNYATARRYIKKPTAQTAQKPAQKSWWMMMASPISNVYLSQNT